MDDVSQVLMFVIKALLAANDVFACSSTCSCRVVGSIFPQHSPMLTRALPNGCASPVHQVQLSAYPNHIGENIKDLDYFMSTHLKGQHPDVTANLPCLSVVLTLAHLFHGIGVKTVWG